MDGPLIKILLWINEIAVCFIQSKILILLLIKQTALSRTRWRVGNCAGIYKVTGVDLTTVIYTVSKYFKQFMCHRLYISIKRQASGILATTTSF